MFVKVGMALLCAALQGAAVLAQGVLVEEVEKGTPADGPLRPGDVVLSWAPVDPARAATAGGPLDSPFALASVEVAWAQRMPVVLRGRRAGQPFESTVTAGEWKLRARPAFTGDDEAAYARGETLQRSEAAGAGLEAWRELAETLTTRGEDTAACWLLLRRAEAAAASEDAFAEAADACAATGDPRTEAFAHEAQAAAAQKRRRPGEAETEWRAAVAQWKSIEPRSLEVVAALNKLAFLVWGRGRLPEAKELYTQALALGRELAPGSLEVAVSLNYLGPIAIQRGEPGARALLEEALAIRERLVPRGMSTARTLANTAIIAAQEGDLAAAEELDRRSLEIASTFDPNGASVAITLSNLGNILNNRGDKAGAETIYRRALALAERNDPASEVIASLHVNLGGIAFQCAEWDAALAHYRKALALFQVVAPDSAAVAAAQGSVASVLRARGELDAAEAAYRAALPLVEKQTVGGITMSGLLVSLVEVATARGDEAGLDALAQRARGLLGTLPAMNQWAARMHLIVADVAARRGRDEEALAGYAVALDIYRRLAPGSESLADAYGRLADLHRSRGRMPQAMEAHEQALRALEEQGGRLARRDEDRVGFRSRHARLYQDALETLLDAGRPEDAFLVWERSRARALLDLLAERDVALDVDLPPDLRRERRRIDAAYDRTQAGLGRAAGPAEQEPLLEALAGLRQERADVRERARQASPRLGSVAYPRALDLAAARRELDEGTTLLAFAVGPSTTRLLVLEGTGGHDGALTAYTLPVGESALREQVGRFREMIAGGPQGGRTAALSEAGRALYRLLLAPAEEHLSAARRLLIGADGPLLALPFAALVREGAQGRPVYLVEWKPVHVAASVTLYAQLRRRAVAARPMLVAFGDPDYGGAAAAAAPADEDIAGRRRSAALVRLPGTAEEVRELGRLFAGAAVHTGRAATEERAKAVGPDARYVHFACHALIDERFPLDSGLALARPGAGPAAAGGDNGLLQAWEIMEGVRLEADLVTLSACESGLGREAAGEGLLGLTRAFHFAGARTVLASLWSVGDDSTRLLMTRFYRALKRGRPKDEALREAQRALLRSPRHAHPFHWAAFVLSGDWR